VNPCANLALEQYVFDSLPRDRAYLLLWQNDKTIVVGRYQSTLAEINETYVRAHKIQVVRRLSGGGAVYHDLGNLNFTFIMDAQQAQELNFSLFCQPVVETLRDLGVDAQMNGRNDITVAGKKFSGNSQYIRQGRVLHHGTILFDSQLDVVGEALQADPAKIQTKGIPSVRSRVTNLSQYLPANLTLPQFKAHLLEHIFQGTPPASYRLSDCEQAGVDALQRARYDTWAWNYGASPPCSMRKKGRVEGCGTVEAHLLVEGGVIASLCFRGDFFSLSDPDELGAKFVGLRPNPEDYQQVLAQTEVSRYISGLSNGQLLEILCR
jgi:lipoate-protein ligase A